MSLPWLLFAHFLALSLVAIGGGIVLIPELHRLLVDELKLLSDPSFTSSIAIAQAAPGPNVLFIAVLGFRAAGLWGALATMAGVMLPSATLALLVNRWLRTRAQRIGVQAFKAAMAPLVIALMCATGYTLAAENAATPQLLVTAASALLVWRTRIPLLYLISLAAVAGALGWV